MAKSYADAYTEGQATALEQAGRKDGYRDGAQAAEARRRAQSERNAQAAAKALLRTIQLPITEKRINGRASDESIAALAATIDDLDRKIARDKSFLGMMRRGSANYDSLARKCAELQRVAKAARQVLALSGGSRA